MSIIIDRVKYAWSQAAGSKNKMEDSVSANHPAGWTDTAIFVCLVIMVLTLPFPDLTGVVKSVFFWLFVGSAFSLKIFNSNEHQS